jgi:hypothetical protein
MSNNIPQKPSIAKKDSILGWLRNQVSKSVYKDISLLLSTCCVPTVNLGTFSCTGIPGIYGVLFTGVTISDTALANQTVQVVFTAPEYAGVGALTTITLDSNGFWTGNIQSSFEGSIFSGNYTLTITVELIPTTLSIVHRSVPIIVTVPNCD